MSYLDAPRLHFRGWFQADVSTINNKVQMYQNESFVPDYQDFTASNWNPQGTGIFRLLDCGVTGGFLDGRQLAAADDPVIGMSLQNAGDRAPGKLVDLDPQQQMVSEIWGMQVRLLDAAAQALFTGEYKPSPFINLWQRQQTGVMLDQKLAAYYQSVLEDVRWADDVGSPLLEALKAVTREGMLSIQFNVFGYARDPKIPRYTQGHAVGTIGPYLSGEPKLFVPGRQMVAPLNQNLQPPANLQSLQAKVAEDGMSLTLDFGNSFPIQDADSGLLDVGTVLVAVANSNPAGMLATVDASAVTLVGAVPYTQADWYTRTAGVQTFDLSRNADARRLLPGNPLLLLSPVANTTTYTVLLQETLDGLYVRADQFVFRLEPGETQEVRFYATQFGAPLGSAAIACTPNDGLLGGNGGGTIAPPLSPPAAVPDVGTPANGLRYSANASTGGDGWATLALSAPAQGPGRPRGYIAGQLYGIGYQLAAQPAGYVSNMFNVISVLAYSARAVPAAPTWYQDIQPLFAQFGNLYPIMSRYVVNLGDYASVVQHLRILKLAFSLPRHDPNHMPVTRDLGAGDRDTILKWLDTPGADGLPLPGT
ncbi:hypothetical protein, partial [Ramlibacter sp.]|uniref:hypothetical protein n=1 Tax=Ramlibacter sp. TaxID=1917967 RepID=UPI00181B2DD2